MSLKPREFVQKKLSFANRYGALFAYEELCERLQELEAMQSVQITIKPSYSQNKHIFLSKSPAKVSKATPASSLLNASKSLLNRSCTPSKLRTKKVFKASNFRIKPVQPAYQRRQASLSQLAKPVLPKVRPRLHQKSKSFNSFVDLN